MNGSDWAAKEKGELYKGMPVTEHGYSDRYGAIVAWVSQSRKQAVIVYTSDDGKVDGLPDAQPIRLASNGKWYLEGAKGSTRVSLTLGRADNYRDPSF